MRRDSERIADIVEACALIGNCLESRTPVDFTLDSLFWDAVVRQLTIAVEAAVNLSSDFESKYPEIPWQEIAGFRNRIVHDYFGFNLDTAWQVATRSLPVLAEQLSTILRDDFLDDNS